MREADASGSLRWAEVDLGALQHNAEQVRALLSPQTRLMAMVKANGYGHGLLLAADGAVRGGASWLGVYHAGEALALRAAGFELPVLVVGAVPASQLAPVIEAGVDVALLDVDDLAGVEAAARATGRRARVHLKIDTGLNRLGMRPDVLPRLVRALAAARAHLDIAGVFTHFASADAPDLHDTEAQHARFLEAAAGIREMAPEALLHCAGSAAILRAPGTHHDLVRLGIALYGYTPSNAEAPWLRVAMSVFARVVQVKTIPPGDTVGYGRTWRADSDRRVATVAMGYGQGLPRYVSNRGWVVIRGVRCAVAGIVSMDQIGVDVSDVPDATAGDSAMLIGVQDECRVGADEIANLGGTLPHEVICGISLSVPRFPVGSQGALDG